jgi:hypothetical protein
MFPALSEFLRAPPRRQGQHQPKVPPLWEIIDEQLLRERLAQADKDVMRIRRIWREQLGKTYRRTAPTAVEIATRRHGVSEQQLENYRKSRHRRR